MTMQKSRIIRRHSLKAVLLYGTMAAMLPAAATAQTADNSSSVETTRSVVDGENVIIVTARNYVPEGSITATKSTIPLIETPQSVSVVTRDQIDLLNFIDAQQAVRYTSGVFGENYGPDLRFDFFTVRGFTPKQYIDGLAAPISTSIYSVGVDLYAFENLDLLKGPASVMYGNSPPGGIFNETSRRASSSFGGEISAKYGTDDYKQLAGTMTGPVNDAISARFTALYRDRDAERALVHAKRLLASPTVTWEIGPDTKLTGLLYYQYDKVQGDTNGFLPVYGTLLDNPIGEVSRSTNLGDPRNVYRRRQYGIGYDFSHRFASNITFHSNTKWSEYDEETPIGIYGSGGLINTTDPTDPSYYRTVLQSNFSYKESVTSFATDNRVDAMVDTGALSHDIVVGLDYRNIFNDAAYNFVFGTGTIDLFDPVYTDPTVLEPGYPTRYNTQRLKQTGIYAQDHIGLGNLYFTLSGRYDWVKSTYLPPFAAATTTTPVTRVKQHKFTYRLGANYIFDNGIAPYVSYATSFEPVFGTDSVSGDPFKPSQGKQWEGGVKYDARGLADDVKLFVTAAVFDIKQTNVVSTSPSVSPVFGTQSGEVEVYGGELEFVARIRDQLSINGSYSYTHSKVLASTTAAEVGAPLPTTPKNKASLFVDYTFQRGTLGGLGIGFGGRYTSTSAGSLPGLFNPIVYYGEAATLFDAIVHYDTPGWRFAVNGSNIFDKKYVARCSGPAGCTYGAGVQVIGTVTKKF